jgi:hypothetical protein
LLIALLPVIALVVYIEGQTYDPALLTFTSSDISAGVEAALFPRSIDGFNRAGQVRLYTKENLYEYVNGHAEYFLSAGFDRLAVGEYIRTDTVPDQPDIVVDIYDMGKAIHAFGVLSDEIGDDASTVQIGMMGAKTAQGISFVSGKYYVKIASYQDEMPVDEFAKRIDQMIDSSPDEITVFSLLPDLGEVITTRFVKEAYRGLGFVNNVVEREYRVNGKAVQVSLVTGSDVDMQKLVSSYLAFFEESGTPYKQTVKDGQKIYTVMDPYEGDWYLVPLAGSVFGVYGEVDRSLLDRLLSSLMRTNTVKGG